MELWVDSQVRCQVNVSTQCPHCIEVSRAAKVPKLQLIDGKLARMSETVQVCEVLPERETHVRGCRKTAAQERHR
jgi:hypothetical protein